MPTPVAAYKYGSYVVLIKDGQYVVHNVTTEVDEYSTSVLYEAIRLCKTFETAVKQAIENDSNVNTNWGKPVEDDEEDARTLN